MALLEILGVRSGYGTGPDILTDVTLTIEEGRSYCVIGPNGAGKSTLLKTISGILSPRSGRIVFDGQEIGGLRPDLVLRAGVCFVPQDRTVFPEMTVRENLVMGAFIVGDRSIVQDRLDAVMEMLPKLGDRSNQMAQTMSGGEQQMLAMGRALMIEPKLMMVDEPSLGMAPRMAEQIFDIIESLKRDLGMTILMVEQNVRMGLAVADYSFVFDMGKNRFEGPADEIGDDPRIRELYLGSMSTGNGGTPHD